MNNAVKLLIITVVTFSISGYLFYQGLKPELEKTDLVAQINQTPSPLPVDVLGANRIGFGEVLVVKVVDGDTIEVVIDGQNKKLRYIGINTPETVDPRKGVECFGREASDENKRLVEGRNVLLEKDISETDKFGRLLRYVYLPLEDGTKLFVNDYLVRSGFASADSFPPDVKYSNRLLMAQQEARDNRRGLWESCSK